MLLWFQLFVFLEILVFDRPTLLSYANPDTSEFDFQFLFIKSWNNFVGNFNYSGKDHTWIDCIHDRVEIQNCISSLYIPDSPIAVTHIPRLVPSLNCTTFTFEIRAVNVRILTFAESIFQSLFLFWKAF